MTQRIQVSRDLWVGESPNSLRNPSMTAGQEDRAVDSPQEKFLVPFTKL